MKQQLPDVSSPTRKKKLQAPDWMLMFGKFLRQGTSIASFVPSSRFLARGFMKGIDFDNAKCIVELGAGTGPITKQLVAHAKPGTRLVILERDPDFCKRLREKFPTYDVVEGDAAHLQKILADFGIQQADHVLSGLPLPSFPKELRSSIIDASMKVLTPNGSFRQLTNMPWVYYRLYRNYFQNVKFRFIPLNFPPAGFYICQNYIAK